ncbi:26S proteasome regulatory subunit [Dispira simplex]|nr:26S proteasome regulatory subunit [Dispira simplex]
MEIDNAVAEFLEVERKRAPTALQSYYTEFADLYDRRLWHQLTESVERFTQQPDARPYLVALYQHFVVDWEKKMNPVKLVIIALAVARQYQDIHQALEFIEDIRTKVDTDASQEACALAMFEGAHFRLLLGQLDTTAEGLEKGEAILDRLASVEQVINASFYRVSADYYKAKADFGQYYKHALLYLACVSLDAMPKAEKVERAHDLALAALLSDKIYNFGDLLMHPILQSLQGTPHAWLGEVLTAFNAGQITRFDGFASQFAKQPLLQSHAPFLRQKVCLMTLIELMFQRISTHRRIPFNDIAQTIHLPLEEVELLVMKALSLDLIRGSIDQVDQVVNIRWVQPRFLNKAQIKNMAEQLQQWKEKVAGLSAQMESQSQELIA